MVTCPSCGVSTSFCPRCGYPLLRTSIICDSCKQTINYCFNCNTPLREISKEITAPAETEAIKAPIPKEAPKIPLKVCFFHPKIEAIAKCDVCNKLLCKDCAKKFGDLILCPEDYPKDIELIEYAPPSPIIKKYPKITLILLISSIFLIFLQIFFILYQPSLFFREALFISINYIVYALLVVNILIIISIALILKSKYPTLGSFIAMFASLISLFIGGGFFIGSILGVAGGITSMVEG